MNRELSKAISQGRRRAHRERVKRDTRPPHFTKECRVCKKIKHVDLEHPGFSEFVIRKKRLKSGVLGRFPASECKECARERTAAWRQRQRESGELARREKEWNSRRDQEARRRYLSSYKRAKKWGIDFTGQFYRSERFQAWLRTRVCLLPPNAGLSEIGSHADPRPRLGDLADHTGIPLKRLRSWIRHKNPSPVEIREADRLVTYFGEPDLLWELLGVRVYPKVTEVWVGGKKEIRVSWTEKKVVR